MRYGRAIKVARAAAGLTQAQLADRLTVGQSHLSLIEAERRNPSLEVLQEIATALDVPVHLLTLLASEPEDLDDPKNAGRVTEVARALLRLLTSAGEQPSLPLEKKESA
jgi:transcriptional regulator with XRE-family HTH domain